MRPMRLKTLSEFDCSLLLDGGLAGVEDVLANENMLPKRPPEDSDWVAGAAATRVPARAALFADLVSTEATVYSGLGSPGGRACGGMVPGNGARAERMSPAPSK